MPKKLDEDNKIVACRMSLAEFAELDTYLQRAGIGRSDFMRNALLAKVRGATTFAELLPTIAASMERQMAELTKTVNARSDEIRVLAAAAVASSAMLLDDGKSAREVAAQTIEEGITAAVAFAPRVIGYVPRPQDEAENGDAKR